MRRNAPSDDSEGAAPATTVLDMPRSNGYAPANTTRPRDHTASNTPHAGPTNARATGRRRAAGDGDLADHGGNALRAASPVAVATGPGQGGGRSDLASQQDRPDHETGPLRRLQGQACRWMSRSRWAAWAPRQ